MEVPVCVCSLAVDLSLEGLSMFYSRDQYIQESQLLLLFMFHSKLNSPVVANLYMEFLEDLALHSSTTKPDIWLRYVDDTFVLWPHGNEDLRRFLHHLNLLRPSIQFTMEHEQEQQLAFSVLSNEACSTGLVPPADHYCSKY